jgi:hypothetical protein
MINSPLPPFISVLFFSAEKHACGPKERVLRGKSIGPVISDCGFRILWVFFFNPHSAIGIPQFGGGPIGRYRIRNSECGIRNTLVLFSIPHSAIAIPHFNCPPGPRSEMRLMVFSRNTLPSGPGNAWNSIHLPPKWRKVEGQGDLFS